MGYPEDFQGNTNCKDGNVIVLRPFRVWKFADIYLMQMEVRIYVHQLQLIESFVLLALDRAKVRMNPVQYIQKRSKKGLMWQFSNKDSYKE